MCMTCAVSVNTVSIHRIQHVSGINRKNISSNHVSIQCFRLASALIQIYRYMFTRFSAVIVWYFYQERVKRFCSKIVFITLLMERHTSLLCGSHFFKKKKSMYSNRWSDQMIIVYNVLIDSDLTDEKKKVLWGPCFSPPFSELYLWLLEPWQSPRVHNTITAVHVLMHWRWPWSGCCGLTRLDRTWIYRNDGW